MKNHQARPSLTETGYCKCGRPLDSAIHYEQPQHTRGEWATTGKMAFKTDLGRYKLQIMRGECAPLNTNIVATAFGNTKEEAEANAQRIVKAAKVLSLIEKYQSENGYAVKGPIQDAILETFSKLLKQAEQK